MKHSLNMNLQKYLAFVKTVEYQSFTKAAAELKCSQSGVSRMISDLEREWQVVLLARNRAGVRLTAEGQKLLPYVRQVLEQCRLLQNQVDELAGLESGLIRIGTFLSVATHWLPGIIREFQKSYPHIEYEFLLGDYDEIEEWILEGRVDCGFLRLPVSPELETLPLARDKHLVIMPEGHELAGCARFPLAALERYPFMLQQSGECSDVTEILARHGLHPQVSFSTWDDYVIMSMVESGLGISILPQLILQRAPYRIVARELEQPAYRDIVFCLRSREQASQAVKRFIDYLPPAGDFPVADL